MKGPRNALAHEEIERAAQERLEAMRLPPMPPIKEWRLPPEGREYARRYQVWELLAWYHHQVLTPELTLWAWVRRKWRALFGGDAGRLLNMSPWQQLALKDRWAAEDWVRREALERARDDAEE